MMVGVIAAVAVVIIAFFGAGIFVGVIWIYAMAVRRERRPEDIEGRGPQERDPRHEEWPNRY